MSDRITLANIVTLLNLVAGIGAIAFALSLEFRAAGIALLCGVLFDVFDGRLARRSKTNGRFGMYLDSLADIVTFGVAPVVIAFMLEKNMLWITLCAAFFVACGAFRLARFQDTDLKGEFQGIPITANGILVGVGLLLLSPSLLAMLFPWYFFVMGVLMVSTFRVKKFSW